MVFLSVLFQYLMKIPHFLFLIFRDLFEYIRRRKWLNFEGWGLHVYVGVFGAGKTVSMVRDAYALAKKYPQLTILTNLVLTGFPEHTRIMSLKSPQDILTAPENTLVLIDEIGTIFNSRDFASSKKSVPKILFQHLCQCRKRRMMIFATSQRWNFVDKQLRDIVATVRVCRSHFGHPFTRVSTVYHYDAFEYDTSFSNQLIPLRPLSADVYIQTDKVRSLYDTSELIDNMLNDTYVSDDEILRNRGDVSAVIAGADEKVLKTAKKTVKKVS